MIIAIDGPAASGKGTVAKRLAVHYGLRHLDTGLLYRAVGAALLEAGHRPDDRAHAIAAARALNPSRFDENALKRQEVGEAASIVSAIPEVRAARRLGLRCLALSVVTNVASTDVQVATTPEDVVAAANRASTRIGHILRAAITEA